MTNINIPASLTNLGQNAFCFCNNLTTVKVDANNPAYSSEDGILFNKDRTVLLLYPEAKPGNYTVPDQVARIESAAFEDCYLLTNIVFGRGLTSIGELAFDSSALTCATIPAGVTNIGSNPFSGCWNMLTITVDAANPAYTSAGGVLFDHDQRLLVQFPCGVSGSYAVPESVTSIGDGAFCLCWGLTNIVLNTNLLDIGNWAFFGCESLASIALPNTVTNLGDWAFYDCLSLTNCELGDSLAQLGTYSFGFCSNLPDIATPDSVTDIGDNAFLGCSCLSRVTLGNSITNIGAGVFSSCALTNITLPASLFSIGNGDFSGCSNLVGIYFKGNAPAGLFAGWPDAFFFGSDATCYCLPGATGWNTNYPWPTAVVWDPRMQTQSTAPGGADKSVWIHDHGLHQPDAGGARLRGPGQSQLAIAPDPDADQRRRVFQRSAIDPCFQAVLPLELALNLNPWPCELACHRSNRTGTFRLGDG
jgi:hypothetical protein